MPPRDPDRPGAARPIHLRILSFFADNAGSIDTPRGVATWIDEPLSRVRRALEELTDAGILKAHRTSSTVGYSCGLSSQDIRKYIAKASRG